ncbi:MAG TPA: hypothetical protein VFF17_01780 [Thermoanaerobaculia bacterium]|nr:hypothetical protein [Thermoanaerobaculia bacterium]
MPRSAIAVASFLLSTGLAGAQGVQPKEVGSVDAIVSELYASVSHPAGTAPDFDRMRRIFHSSGKLVPPKAPDAPDFRPMTVDQFSERIEKLVADRKAKGEPLSGFFEREIARRTDCFGNVCHVFSTYESRRSPSDRKPFERGINSIQLVNDGKRWWIASVIWDAERPANPIPASYLPEAKP